MNKTKTNKSNKNKIVNHGKKINSISGFLYSIFSIFLCKKNEIILKNY